jgi:hypothetical protein
MTSIIDFGLRHLCTVWDGAGAVLVVHGRRRAGIIDFILAATAMAAVSYMPAEEAELPERRYHQKTDALRPSGRKECVCCVRGWMYLRKC